MSSVSVWEQQWPDLFDRLDAKRRKLLVAALANGYLEEDLPDRGLVEMLVDRATGVIDFTEFRRRAEQRATGR